MVAWRKGRNGRRLIHCELNAKGDLSGPAKKSAPACLHLRPGGCLLRTFDSGGMSAREIGPALELWAEASLPLPPDQYYTESWTIDADSHGLAAVPREPLDRARKKLLAGDSRPAAVRIPELRPPLDARPTLVFWTTPNGLLACLWRDQVLYHWQSFSPAVSRQAIVEQLTAAAEPAPEAIYLSWMRSERAPWFELITTWPDAEIIETWDWDLEKREHGFGPGPQLKSYVFEEQRQPATAGDKLRLGLALSGTVCAGLFMFFAEVGHLEGQAEQLRHQVSLLKVKASRSEKIAARSGQTLRQIRELQAMTVERSGILDVLMALSNALPPRVRLDRINVERSGVTALDGVAESELDVSNFLETLGQTPLLGEPRLTFTQKEEAKEGAEGLVRFRLEARLGRPLLSLPGDQPIDPAAPADDEPDSEGSEA